MTVNRKTPYNLTTYITLVAATPDTKKNKAEKSTN